MDSLNEIRVNAQNGLEHCKGCPAQEATDGEYVNPGMFNYNAEIMFITMDPSHNPYWDEFENWEDYNESCHRRFLNPSWSGYEPLSTILNPIDDISIKDIWLADSIKCPVDNSLRSVSSREISETFEHCRHYLRREIDEVDPSVIVTFGADSGERVLSEYYDIDVELKTGHKDCGRVFRELEPPVLVSPHWFHGWLGKKTDGRKNAHIVRDKLVALYNSQ